MANGRFVQSRRAAFTSRQVTRLGSGRRFDEAGFLDKLKSIKGYILSDITVFPAVEVFVVPVANVVRWHSQFRLGVNARTTRRKFLSELAPDIRY